MPWPKTHCDHGFSWFYKGFGQLVGLQGFVAGLREHLGKYHYASLSDVASWGQLQDYSRRGMLYIANKCQ